MILESECMVLRRSSNSDNTCEKRDLLQYFSLVARFPHHVRRENGLLNSTKVEFGRSQILNVCAVTFRVDFDQEYFQENA